MTLTRSFALRILAVLLALGVMVSTYLAVEKLVQARLANEAESSAQLRVQALESILAKQRAVAAVLSDDDTLRAVLKANAPRALEDVSRKLERLRGATQSAVIYILDRDGLAVASSNWDEPQSFVGQHYDFRAYYANAMRNGSALEYALGTVSKRAGLYLSNRVDGPNGPLGVVIVKVEFDAYETSWRRSPDDTYVLAPNGEVVLAGETSLRFQKLPPQPPGFRTVTEAVSGAGWLLTLRYSIASARLTAALATAVVGALMLALAFWRSRIKQQRRRRDEAAAREASYRTDLERAVEERTRDLSASIREKRTAEQRLAAMQADLVQANKLATLGQVTAGVAHEVNQPLATIRLLAENASALLAPPANPDVLGNLGRIVQMTDRISQITTELRSFSRKATGKLEPVRVQEVIEASLLLTASRRRVEGAALTLAPFDPDLRVMAEAVRLEQILVNLIQNAQEAVAGQPAPEIRIGVTRRGDEVELTVVDNGHGLTDETWANLFIPFSTSKPDGVGLGLVIAQGIARDFGGELRADRPVAGQGATFRVILKAAP